LADSGKKGIEKALYGSPDIIILDVQMPEMDDYEVCKAIKSFEQTKHILIMMITGMHKSSEKYIKGLNAGAELF
jgi:putative two-component system response regulator